MAGRRCSMCRRVTIFYSHEWLSSFQQKEMHRVRLYSSGNKGVWRGFGEAQGRNLGQPGRGYICGPRLLGTMD